MRCIPSFRFALEQWTVVSCLGFPCSVKIVGHQIDKIHVSRSFYTIINIFFWCDPLLLYRTSICYQKVQHFKKKTSILHITFVLNKFRKAFLQKDHYSYTEAVSHRIYTTLFKVQFCREMSLTLPETTSKNCWILLTL